MKEIWRKGTRRVQPGFWLGRHNRDRRQLFMNKSLLSEVLDGAAFPAIMVAVAVSQLKVGPHRNTVGQGTRVGVELQADDGVERKTLKARAR
jgi:hypothetical protein